MASAWYIPASIAASLVLSHLVKEAAHVYRTGEFSFYTLLFETGGMPSSHAASVSALLVAVGLQEGLSALFWACVVLWGVVVRDAFGVRKSVSDQAKVINTLLSRAEIERKVNVVLGHTPAQVVAGIVLGAAVAGGLWFAF